MRVMSHEVLCLDSARLRSSLNKDNTHQTLNCTHQEQNTSSPQRFCNQQGGVDGAIMEVVIVVVVVVGGCLGKTS